MRISCNGCRILRKGCRENCTLQSCLEWIKSPEAQANATLFLAKFYGRSGLINLIAAAPSHLRPQIFKSLMYEACGRIINPVYGSVGLMCTGNWPRCQAAVEAVLGGAPLTMQLTGGDHDGNDSSTATLSPQGCNIRHLSAASLHRTRTRIRTRFKRSPSRATSRVDSVAADFMSESETKFTITGWDYGNEEMERAPSHDSFSVETVEPALVILDGEPVRVVEPGPDPSEVGLELTLGMTNNNPVLRTYLQPPLIEISDSES
ncbi:hypothetical protein BUALT_Bualt05G0128200 [Buddleja alternifolia]|uniref:LOB domain-containing protein n=1 Tax=Buddleja alternifolia TaxID=168488 RepID=A0AAV6XIV9_9LAMI|nr:hypothetical protein BUALT_Bualt05G0128200 [Buddleja alternifolia]